MRSHSSATVSLYVVLVIALIGTTPWACESESAEGGMPQGSQNGNTNSGIDGTTGDSNGVVDVLVGDGALSDVPDDEGGVTSDIEQDGQVSDAPAEASADAPSSEITGETGVDHSGVDGSGSEPSDSIASGTCSSYAAPEARGSLPGDIHEASGLVLSRQHEDLAWVHNDSGDEAVIYAVDVESGELRATVAFDVYASDWEDISLGPCASGADPYACIYMGDIGDNSADQTRIRVHRIVEPDILQLDASSAFETANFRYPGGARDAEALVVDEQGTVYVLTKTFDNHFELWGAPFDPSQETSVQMTSYGEFVTPGMALVTAADYDSSTRRLLVRTYFGAMEHRLSEGETLMSLSLEQTDGVGSAAFDVVPSAIEPQGEAIGLSPDGYWHVSEGDGEPFYFVACE